MEHQQENELLLLIAQQNAEAFACFYDRTSALLHGVAASILRDSALAEDVLQEVYMQIWNKAELYDPRLGKPLSWAIALTRNRALDRLRALTRRERTNRAFEAQAAQIPSEEFANVESAEKKDLVAQALSRLPDKQRRAIELAFFRGLPHAEVAEEMQQPLGTVKAWIRRGLLDLRGALKEIRTTA